MMLHIFMHSKSKRAKAIALLNLGATENFMSLEYTKYLQLPIKTLAVTAVPEPTSDTVV